MNIIDRKRSTKHVVDNLSWMENVLDEPLPIDDSLHDEQLAVINASTSRNNPWYAYYANYIVTKYIPPRYT